MNNCTNCEKPIELDSYEINRWSKDYCRSCDRALINGWNKAVLSHNPICKGIEYQRKEAK